MVRQISKMLELKSCISRQKTLEFDGPPNSFFEKQGVVYEFLDNHSSEISCLQDFEFCVLNNNMGTFPPQKRISRNLSVCIFRLIYFYFRRASQGAAEAVLEDNQQTANKRVISSRSSSNKKSHFSSSGEKSKTSKSSNLGLSRGGKRLNVTEFCRQMCKLFSAQNIDQTLFEYLMKNIDDVLKNVVVEILNSVDIASLKLKQVEIIFGLMQEAKDFTKGKNELVYGNLLLVLTKFLCSSDFASEFLENFGSEWIYELFEMLVKNAKRDVQNDFQEQKEKDILNCCLVHFICHNGSLIRNVQPNMDRILGYFRKILKYEVQFNPSVSPPLEIERSTLTEDTSHLLGFIKAGKVNSLQFFRILSHLANRLDSSVDPFYISHRALYMNQKDIYFSSLNRLRNSLLKELDPFQNSMITSRLGISQRSQSFSEGFVDFLLIYKDRR